MENRKYLQAILDMAGYIKFAYENGDEEFVETNLVHDIMGLARLSDEFFVPRTAGYKKHLCQHNNPAHYIQHLPKGNWTCKLCGKDITGLSIKQIVK